MAVQAGLGIMTLFQGNNQHKNGWQSGSSGKEPV
jgi:hypothetical protein